MQHSEHLDIMLADLTNQITYRWINSDKHVIFIVIRSYTSLTHMRNKSRTNPLPTATSASHGACVRVHLLYIRSIAWSLSMQVEFESKVYQHWQPFCV